MVAYDHVLPHPGFACSYGPGQGFDRQEVEEEEEFEFVEPMVFDLVRGLGAKPGESEVNYLMIIPLNGEPVSKCL